MRSRWFSLALLGSLSACSESQPSASLPYRVGQALVIGSGDDGTITVVDDACESAVCDAVRERCGERAYADVIVGPDDEIVDVICLRDDVRISEPVVDESGEVRVENHTLVSLDAEGDDAELAADVVLAGNGAIVHGGGATSSRVAGDVVVSGNAAILRELTIEGDLVIDGNEAQLAFVVVEGNVTIRGNGASLAASVVLGDLHFTGNDGVLIDNRVQGSDTITGNDLTCDGNLRFQDADADGAASDAELGEVLVCPGGADASDDDDDDRRADEVGEDDDSKDDAAGED